GPFPQGYDQHLAVQSSQWSAEERLLQLVDMPLLRDADPGGLSGSLDPSPGRGRERRSVLSDCVSLGRWWRMFLGEGDGFQPPSNPPRAPGETRCEPSSSTATGRASS